MASRWLPRSQDSQVDPFNAGEPELPWEDPGALADAGSLAGEQGEELADEPIEDELAADEPHLDEPSYAAHGEGPLAGEPHKADDNYRAPTTRRRGYDAPSIEDSAAEKPARPRRRRNRRRASAEPTPTSAHRRGGGLGAVVSIVVFVVALGMAVVGLVGDIIEDAGGGLGDFMSSGTTAADSAFGEGVFDEESEEEAVQDAFEERMDALLANPAAGELHELAASAFDERVTTIFGYSAEQLGLDADAVATWVCGRTSFSVDSVYAYDDGTASLYFDAAAPSVADLVWELDDETSDYLADHDLWGSDVDGEDAVVPSEEDRAYMAGALEDVLGRFGSREAYCSAELEHKDGAWVVDEQDLSEQLDYALGLY